MNSSAGDNSNAKYVGPFGPSPELFHPPRLGIIHLLAWTAVTAVLLKLMMALEFFSPPDELPRAMRIYSVTTLSTDMMILAAGVVGTSVILCSRLRCITGRLQAGHWMLVTTTVVSVFSMPLYLWLFVLNADFRRPLSTNIFSDWLREKLLISRIIHESASVKMLVGVPDTGSRIVPAQDNPQGVETAQNTEKSAKKTTFAPNRGSNIPIL